MREKTNTRSPTLSHPPTLSDHVSSFGRARTNRRSHAGPPTRRVKRTREANAALFPSHTGPSHTGPCVKRMGRPQKA